MLLLPSFSSSGARTLLLFRLYDFVHTWLRSRTFFIHSQEAKKEITYGHRATPQRRRRRTTVSIMLYTHAPLYKSTRDDVPQKARKELLTLDTYTERGA